MKNEEKTKEQLINELVEMRKRITELRKSEAETKRAEELERLRRQNELILNSAGEGIFGLDLQGNHTFVNPSAARMLGYEVEELIGLHSHTIWHHSKADGSPYPEEECLIYKAYKEGSVHHATDEVFWRRDNTIFPVEYTSTPIKEGGKLVGAVVTFMDITERRQVEETLRESEERYRKLIQQSIEAIYMFDPETKLILEANTAFLDLLGYPAEEATTLTLYDFVAHEKESIDAHIQQILTSGAITIGERLWRRKDRSLIDVRVTASKLHQKGRDICFVVARDITERRRAEEALRESFKKLQRTVEGTIQAIAKIIEIWDPFTAGHERRVTQLACAVAREMNLSEKQIEAIHIAGLLHDIGKITIPADILSKHGKINENELDIMRRHVHVGYEILKEVEFNRLVAQIVLQHHERMDGSGYPQNLAGDKILLEARILGVADAVEAMTSPRPHRPPLGIKKTLVEIFKGKSTLFDPEVVDACIKVFTERGFNFV
ncbi:MAG: HD domain-containing phosphohydrolase [Nitrospirota bacterium]